MFPSGVEEVAHDPLSADKSVFFYLPEKRELGIVCIAQLALKQLSPAGPVLPPLDDI